MGILSKLVISLEGDLPHDNKEIKRWIEANGGKYAPRVQNGITHLIASKKAWKDATDRVSDAFKLKAHIVSYDWLEDSLQRKRKLAEKKYTFESQEKDNKRKRELKKLGKQTDGKKFVEGARQIKLLTGSGTSEKLPPLKKPKPSNSFFFADVINTQFVSAADDLQRRRAERETREAAEKAQKAAKMAAKNRNISTNGTSKAALGNCVAMSAQSSASTLSSSLSFAPGLSKPSTPTSAISTSSSVGAQAKTLALKDLYHFYMDRSGFEYKITLARCNFTQNKITRYQLSVLESHTFPHTYCAFVQYFPAGVAATGSSPVTEDREGAHIRDQLLGFLNGDNKASTHTSAATATTDSASHDDTEESTSLEAEAARLNSLVTVPTPSATLPYKTLLCPMHSSFTSAFHAFRHAFRDITLLSWEERFDADKVLQKARARKLGIEPFVYSKPKAGLPTGLMVQEEQMYQGSRSEPDEMLILGDAEDGYVRNQFHLPGLNEKLSKQCFVGAAIARDDEEAEKEAEKLRLEKEGEAEKEKLTKVEKKTPKRPDYKKPLFEPVSGRMRRDAYESVNRDAKAGMRDIGVTTQRGAGKAHWEWDE